ncbi:hypothetical protein OG894_42730 (plasmid) [Streptomyces sp. NBC_01724]|uniref:hypothetical protein n=1 Tax=unclassified Streptomyces TaxID=2593676 RepID=UPI002E301BC4|nr:hypothetical protein [Streptomyces sp. NBC_01724]
MSKWKIAERESLPKGKAPSEDRLVISNTVTAVIDDATDKSGRDYGGMSGGARAAQYVADALASPSVGTMPPPDAVAHLTDALAKLRKEWHVPASDPVGPSAVAAVLAPELGVIWRVGDVHVALRTAAGWS